MYTGVDIYENKYILWYEKKYSLIERVIYSCLGCLKVPFDFQNQEEKHHFISFFLSLGCAIKILYLHHERNLQ